MGKGVQAGEPISAQPKRPFLETDHDCPSCEDERRKAITRHPAGASIPGISPKSADPYERIAEMGEEYAAVWGRFA